MLLSSEPLAKLVKDIQVAKARLILNLRNLPKYLSNKTSTLLNLSEKAVTDCVNLYSVVLEFLQ